MVNNVVNVKKESGQFFKKIRDNEQLAMKNKQHVTKAAKANELSSSIVKEINPFFAPGNL